MKYDMHYMGFTVGKGSLPIASLFAMGTKQNMKAFALLKLSRRQVYLYQ